MNIAYVKMDKPKENKIGQKIKYKIRVFFNHVYKEKSEATNQEISKVNMNNYYIPNLKEKTKNKLIKLLRKQKVDYAITENEIDIDFPKLKGTYCVKYMLPEVAKYCFTLTNTKVEEVSICTNQYTKENVDIIKDLSQKIKVVNIITENSRYLILEKELEKKEIYITVNNNKRKSLKKAQVVINLDFKDFKEYNINRSMIIIDISGNLNLKKGFEGIYIKAVKIKTDKVMRVFSEYEKFSKEELIEAEMIKINEYENVRKYIRMNKFDIMQVIGTREIKKEEFERIERSNKIA